MTLRIVRDEPPKKRGRARREPLFSAEEERILRAALLALRGSYGGWRHLGLGGLLRPFCRPRA